MFRAVRVHFSCIVLAYRTGLWLCVTIFSVRIACVAYICGLLLQTAWRGLFVCVDYEPYNSQERLSA